MKEWDEDTKELYDSIVWFLRDHKVSELFEVLTYIIRVNEPYIDRNQD